MRTTFKLIDRDARGDKSILCSGNGEKTYASYSTSVFCIEIGRYMACTKWNIYTKSSNKGLLRLCDTNNAILRSMHLIDQFY